MKGTPYFKNGMKKVLVFLCFVSLFLFSCKNENKKNDIIIPKDPRTDFSMKRSHEDTVAVMDMADKFLQALQEKNVDAALDQLYEVENNEAKPLTEERRNKLKQTFGAFPVESYTIDAIVLFSDSDSEVRYTTRMFPDSIKSEMPGTTKGSLHPFRINGQWFLTILPIKFEQ